MSESITYIPSSTTECFAEPDGNNIIDLIIPGSDPKISYIERETLEKMRERYPKAEVMLIADWCANKARKQDSEVTWLQTTEERYWEMLEVLPPAYMGNGGFMVGEPTDHHAVNGRPRFAAFKQKGDQYWESSRPMTIQEFRESK